MHYNFNNKIFEKFPILESDRLIFRKFSNKDTGQILNIRSNSQVMKYMDSIVLKYRVEAQTLLKSIQSDYKNCRGISWAIVEKQSNQLIGSFAYWRIIKPHCRAEIGFSLLPDFWGKGLMKETLNTLIEYGFNQMQLHSIEANVNPLNTNSIALLEKVGFKKEAHFRENFLYQEKFLDSYIYCLLETDERFC